MANILVLGAGFVVGPVLEYLCRRSENQLTLASNLLQDAEALAKGFPQVRSIEIDVTDKAALTKIIIRHDIVISLVPYQFHIVIAEICIRQGKPMITASYVSDAMKALDQSAKDAGVLILNEIGLDPGIDHLSAMKVIDEAHEKGGKITEFSSWCGGLPAPECKDNPLGYKFSWAPRAVLLATLNSAQFLKHGELVEIRPEQLLTSTQPVFVNTELSLEGYPNRDSSGYIDVYGIPEVTSLIRGTLRYEGFTEILEAARVLGLLDLERQPADISWRSFLESEIEQTQYSLSDALREKLDWLGVFSDDLMPSKDSMLDAFCELLMSRLSYAEDESDMIVLQHKFAIEFNQQHEYLTSTLIVKGDAQGFSAMAKTVGYPVAIAAQLILDGEIKESGVHIPVKNTFYDPILEALEQEQIVCVESSVESIQENFFC